MKLQMKKKNPQNKRKGILFKERKGFGVISLIFWLFSYLFMLYISKDFHFLSSKHFQNLFNIF